MPIDCGKTLRERRSNLRTFLPSQSILFAIGTEKWRTASSAFAFRGNSHFLFFCGKFPPGSYALLTPQEELLFIPATAPDDPIWHGPATDWSTLAGQRGFQLHSTAELPAKLARLGEVLTLPLLPGDRAQSEVTSLIRRAVEPTGRDRELVEAVIELRLVHDLWGQQEIRNAFQITTEAFAAGRVAVAANVRESDVHAAMLANCLRQGAEQAFPGIVTTHGEVLHNTVSQRQLLDGELLLVDFGAEVTTGYASDVTRTWPVSGKFSPEQNEIYNLVHAAQARGLQMVRPGVRFLDIHLAACREITSGLVHLGLLSGDVDSLVERGAHALFFPHGIGHLLGLDVHDMEDLGDLAGYAPGRKRSTQFGLSFLRLDRDLKAGMAVTIEPGIYFISELLNDPTRTAPFADCLQRERCARYTSVRGIRIEDSVLVTSTGAEVLSQAIAK